jgi:hypothetical protein
MPEVLGTALRSCVMRVLVAGVVSAGLMAPTAASALTLKPGDVVVADIGAYGGDGGLIRVNPDTGKQATLSTNTQPVNSGTSEHLDDPYDVTMAPRGELLAAEEYAPGGPGSVVAVRPATGKQRLVSSNAMPVNLGSSELLLDPWGVLFVPGQGIVVADYNNFGGEGGLVGVDGGTGKQRVLSSNDQAVNSGTSELFATALRLAQARSGELAVANHGSEAGVVGVNPRTGKQRVLSANSQAVNSGTSEFFSTPEAIDVGPDGTLFVTDTSAFSGGGIIGVDPGTGKQAKVSANDLPVNSAAMGFGSPQGVATALNGDLIVAQPTAPPGFGGTNGGLLRIDPQSGALSLLSSNDMAVNSGTSELLADPYGVTVIPPRCSGRYATAYGSAGRQTLPGTRAGDALAGLGGGDTISAGRGQDRACGGSGDDTIRGGARGDLLDGGAGRDVCIGGGGRDRARSCEVLRSI